MRFMTLSQAQFLRNETSPEADETATTREGYGAIKHCLNTDLFVPDASNRPLIVRWHLISTHVVSAQLSI